MMQGWEVSFVKPSEMAVGSNILTPVLQPDEVIVCSKPSVGLYEDNEKIPQLQEGRLYLTPIRVLYHIATNSSDGGKRMNSDEILVRFLPLSILSPSIERYKGISTPSLLGGMTTWSNPKIVVSVPLSDVRRVQYKFSFRGGGCEEFHKTLLEMMNREEWLKRKPAGVPGTTNSPASSATSHVAHHRDPVPSSSEQATSRNNGSCGTSNFTERAGIAFLTSGGAPGTGNGVIEAEQQLALDDIDSLMQNVGDLLGTIKSYKEKLQQKASGGGSDGVAADGMLIDEEATTIVSIEQSLGLGDVVRKSKRMKSSAFLMKLAEELNSWLQHPSNHLRNRIVIPLVELFAVYNQARGTHLVSPSDVRDACANLALLKDEKHSVPTPMWELRTFDSGFLALVRTDEKLVRCLELHIGKRNSCFDALCTIDPDKRKQCDEIVRSALKPLTEAALASSLNVGEEVASEILEDLVFGGVLCRAEDSALEPSFYWNIFRM